MARPLLLTSNEIAHELDGLQVDWHVAENGKLRREIKFANFAAAFGFMAEIAIVAEKLDHHPEWLNVYNRVEVELTTHDVGGITKLDIQLAKAMDLSATR